MNSDGYCLSRTGKRVFDYANRKVYVVCCACGAPSTDNADNVGNIPLHKRSDRADA